MTDWADEAVDELCKEFGFDEGKGLDIYDKQLVSQALRAAELRGRVAGMREAAQMVDDKSSPDSRIISEEAFRDAKGDLIITRKTAGLSDLIREAASKLSPTT